MFRSGSDCDDSLACRFSSAYSGCGLPYTSSWLTSAPPLPPFGVCVCARRARARVWCVWLSPSMPTNHAEQVRITEGSLGLNTWFEAFAYPDTAACGEVKMRHPASWRSTQEIVDFIDIRAAQLEHEQ